MAILIEPPQNELSALQNLSDNAGFLKKTGDGNYSIDNNNYLPLSGGTVSGAIFAGSYNLIPIGRGSGNVSTNTAVGASAGQANTTGVANIFLGVSAGQFNTTGNNNTYLGTSAGQFNTTGNNNLFGGRNAGRFIADGVTELTVINNSCCFGMNTKGTQNATNENVFGFNATGNGSNTVTIGDNNITNNFFRGALSLNATQVISTRRTGWTAPTGTATRATFSTSTVTVSQLAERVKALIDDLIAHGLIGA